MKREIKRDQICWVMPKDNPTKILGYILRTINEEGSPKYYFIHTPEDTPKADSCVELLRILSQKEEIVFLPFSDAPKEEIEKLPLRTSFG